MSKKHRIIWITITVIVILSLIIFPLVSLVAQTTSTPPPATQR